MNCLNDLEKVIVEEIQEIGDDEVYDISNYENDCIDNEGNFFCNDVLVHNCIPEYIKRRDDKEMKWKEGMDPRIVEILKSTYGIITYQEQLQTMWIRLAGFNVPEAEGARKVIAKKWQDKLPQVEKKWKDGAEKVIGKEEADKWWDLMKSFGRYAFNLAHCLSDDTKLEDPITGEITTVSDLYKNKRRFNLLSYQQQGLVPDEVCNIHFNGMQPIYEVELSTGIKQRVTLSHQFLCSDGVMRTVRDIILNSHSIKHICNEVRNEGNNRRREESDRFISNGEIIRQYYFRDKEIYIRWDNQKDHQKVWCTEEIQDKYPNAGTQLFRDSRQTRESVLDRAINGRWLCQCKKGEEICKSAIKTGGFRFSYTIRNRSKYKETTNFMPQEIIKSDYISIAANRSEHKNCGRPCEVWRSTRQDQQRNCAKYSIYSRFSEGFNRRGWFNNNKWERISNDQINIFNKLYQQIQRNYNKQLWCETQQNNKIRQYDSDWLDWIRSMQENTIFYLRESSSISKKEEENCRCHIKSIKYIGIKPTYSPEMKSSSHNYITEIKHGQPIHKNSIAYSIVTYRSLYLKTHYPTHWWSAVMTGCHREKLPNYIRAARSDNVQFKSLDILNLSESSTVVDNMLVPGLIFVKGIGKKAAAELEKIHIKDHDIDKVVESFGRQKTTFERLIKLGAFDAHYPNRKALWMYYLYKYGSKQYNKEVVDLVNEKYKWPDEKILAERRLREQDYRNRYPKRNKIPAAITNWKPKINPTREEIMALFKDYTNSEKLEIEKEFYGHYWTNPITLFVAEYPIDKSKPRSTMDVVIEEIHRRISKKNNVYYIFRVTDGKSCVDVIVWQNVFRNSDKETIQPGRGIRMEVECETGNFAIDGNNPIRPLRRVTERDGMW